MECFVCGNEIDEDDDECGEACSECGEDLWAGQDEIEGDVKDEGNDGVCPHCDANIESGFNATIGDYCPACMTGLSEGWNL
jgi:predicted RNA-binding Zn-ribbon protein involved in translation (DUF1610 family)